MASHPTETRESGGHTWGPWDAVAKTEHHGWFVEDVACRTVCDLYYLERDGSITEHQPARAEANARLIAAAPDLLEAAKLALAGFEHLDFGHTRQAKLLRAAIARAERPEPTS